MERLKKGGDVGMNRGRSHVNLLSESEPIKINTKSSVVFTWSSGVLSMKVKVIHLHLASTCPDLVSNLSLTFKDYFKSLQQMDSQNLLWIAATQDTYFLSIPFLTRFWMTKCNHT